MNIISLKTGGNAALQEQWSSMSTDWVAWADEFCREFLKD